MVELISWALGIVVGLFAIAYLLLMVASAVTLFLEWLDGRRRHY